MASARLVTENEKATDRQHCVERESPHVQLTVNKQTALYLLRSHRAARGKRGLGLKRQDLLSPNPSPGKRWTRRLLDPANWGLGASTPARTAGWPEVVDVCAGSASERVKSRFASSTVYDKSVPEQSFLRLSPALAISSPELLFVELAPSMTLPARLQLGFELCGGYSRKAGDPVGGDAAMEIPPVTSVAKITRYLEQARYLKGTELARRALRLLADNAWSPAEATVATMMALPLEEYGYGIGRLKLNPRMETPAHLQAAAWKSSRVPDILVADTGVGINYDGSGHLNLDAIARAGIGLGRDLGSAQRERELNEALQRVRAKALDDIRRDRELTADGLTVFTVYKEDLYEYGGLDKVMMQVLTALQLRENWDVCKQMKLLSSSFARRERQALVYSMMPGGWQVSPSDEEHAFVRI